MTMVKRVLPARSYRVSIRVVGRRFYLRPDEEVTETLGYWIGLASQRYGIEIHAVIVMSNHVHLDVTDYRGLIPDFIRDLKAQYGRGSWNIDYERAGPLWADEKGRVAGDLDGRGCGARDGIHDAQRCVGGAGEVGRAVAGVEVGAGGPGSDESGLQDVHLSSGRSSSGDPRTGGTCRGEVTWSLTPHPLGADDPEAFLARVKELFEEGLAAKLEEMRKKKRRFKFKNPAEASSQPFWHKARRKEGPKRDLRFVTQDKERWKALRKEHWDFQAQYRDALKCWAKDGKATFPPGTFKMRGAPGVTVREGPAPTERGRMIR